MFKGQKNQPFEQILLPFEHASSLNKDLIANLQFVKFLTDSMEVARHIHHNLDARPRKQTAEHERSRTSNQSIYKPQGIITQYAGKQNYQPGQDSNDKHYHSNGIQCRFRHRIDTMSSSYERLTYVISSLK